MVKNKKIEDLIDEQLLSRIRQTERERYITFFISSSKENLAHAVEVKERFPRWSIISGYYAMHDAAKLLLAAQFNLKVDFKVHTTTIAALKALVKDEILVRELENAKKEFFTLANDLATAKRERVKAQYYTGSAYMKREYGRRARTFLKNVERFLKRAERLRQ